MSGEEQGISSIFEIILNPLFIVFIAGIIVLIFNVDLFKADLVGKETQYISQIIDKNVTVEIVLDKETSITKNQNELIITNADATTKRTIDNKDISITSSNNILVIQS